jgi:hypothetical protein
MDNVYEIPIHKVHDEEGSVNEMTGDGIMALFGARLTRPILKYDPPFQPLFAVFKTARGPVTNSFLSFFGQI